MIYLVIVAIIFLTVWNIRIVNQTNEVIAYLEEQIEELKRQHTGGEDGRNL